MLRKPGQALSAGNDHWQGFPSANQPDKGGDRDLPSQYRAGLAPRRPVCYVCLQPPGAIWGISAKSALHDSAPLEMDIRSLSAAIVQLYKGIVDYEANEYPSFGYSPECKIYPIVVTLEDWHFYGEPFIGNLQKNVVSELERLGMSKKLVDEVPYSICSVQEFETAVQLIRKVGISRFMDGMKLDPEMSRCSFHPYMVQKFSKEIAKILLLFEHELRQLIN